MNVPRFVGQAINVFILYVLLVGELVLSGTDRAS